MVKPEWGTRRICYKCATRFYDLLKEPPICPKCAADQTKAPAKHSSSSPARKIKAAVPEEDTDEPVVLPGESEEIEEIGLDELEEEELPEDDA